MLILIWDNGVQSCFSRFSVQARKAMCISLLKELGLAQMTSYKMVRNCIIALRTPLYPLY